MTSLLRKVRKLGSDALEGAQSLGSSITDRAKNIDLSDVTERVSAGYSAVVDQGGKIVDAAGNRVTHPATAFDEGFEACRQMWRSDNRDAADAARGSKTNPYE